MKGANTKPKMPKFRRVLMSLIDLNERRPKLECEVVAYLRKRVRMNNYVIRNLDVEEWCLRSIKLDLLQIPSKFGEDVEVVIEDGYQGVRYFSFKYNGEDIFGKSVREEIRNLVKENRELIIKTPRKVIECESVLQNLNGGMALPRLEVEIRRDFEGGEYFSFKYQGQDIFGESV